MCKAHMPEQAPTAPEVLFRGQATGLAALVDAGIGEMQGKIKMFLYAVAVCLWN